jgi:hypothetical protein
LCLPRAARPNTYCRSALAGYQARPRCRGGFDSINDVALDEGALAVGIRREMQG